MRLSNHRQSRFILTAILILQLIAPAGAFFPRSSIKIRPIKTTLADKINSMAHSTTAATMPLKSLRALQTTSSLQLLGPNQETIPVVNVSGQIQLSVTDAAGQPVSGVTFESGSTDVATIDAATGMVSGVKEGYATVTARRGNDTVSAFVEVALVSDGNGKPVEGDTKVDTSGAVYISDPTSNVVYKRETAEALADVFAGQINQKGLTDAARKNALFSAPTAVAVDNRANGGIYVADTLNHCIRRIGFDDNVTTVLNKGGAPGVISADSVPLGQEQFRSPQGIAVDSGGNLYIADTENHAIYVADFTKNEVRLLAGTPGSSGKANGTGRDAKFNRPTALSIQDTSASFFGSSSTQGIFVSDTGNGRIRLITFDGEVTTVGKIKTTIANPNEIAPLQSTNDEFAFQNPRSVSTDGLGNIFIVDDTGVKVVKPTGNTQQLTTLAQANSFSQAMSVVNNGNQVLVLDKAASDARSLKSVVVGEPRIGNLSETFSFLDGGREIVVTGRNFAPESLVILGDSIVNDAIVESATSIRLRVPPQKAPGQRTISVQTRGGVAQTAFNIISPGPAALNDGEITTVVGGIPFLGDGGRGRDASLRSPHSLAIDGEGNIFISDSFHNRVRRLETNGLITTVAGTGSSGAGADGAPAISTSLDLLPAGGIGVDQSGNLLIAETTNQRIRRVDVRTGIITTIAGTGMPGFTGDNGPATSATLFLPDSVAVDLSGNIFIADTGNHSIRRIDGQTGVITTVIGNGRSGFSGDNGPASAATLFEPRKLAFDSIGNLFIADSRNHRIRRVDRRTGVITTVAGNGTRGFSGDRGPATAASLADPLGLVIGPNGGIVIADSSNNRVRLVDARTGVIDTIAGGGTPGPGNGDGDVATRAALNRPEDVGLDGAGNLLIADANNNVVRIVDRSLNIRTLAGNGRPNFGGDGGQAFRADIDLLFSSAVETDRRGNTFFVDQSNNRIRRIDPAGIITTVAGNGMPGSGGDGGPATNASLNQPNGIMIDTNGNLFIADTGNNCIRRVDSSGTITRVIGTGQPGFSGDNGPASNAQLNQPTAIALDPTGGVVIADAANFRIRRVDTRSGMITTVAGTGMKGFSGDGGMARNATFGVITSLAIDKMGQLIVCDSDNHRIRQIDPRTTIVRTIVGNGDNRFNGDDQLAINASLFRPMQVIVDDMNNLIIADSFNHRIRRVRAGIIKTIAGSKRGFSGDGTPSVTARLNKPTGIAFDGMGNLIIADTDNNSLRFVRAFDRADAIVDFNVTASPDAQTINAGSSTSFNIELQALNRFSSPVMLRADVIPPNPNINITFTPGSATPGTKVTMTVTTTANTPASTFNINVAGVSNRIVRNQSVALVVRRATTDNFSLAISPSNSSIKPGNFVSFLVNVQQVGSFNQSVNLSASVDDANGNITARLTNSSVTPGSSTSLRVDVPAGTPTDTYNITVTGISGQLVSSQSVAVTVTADDPVPTGPMITNAQFNKPTLTITGSGFGSSGAVVSVNGQTVSSRITSQTDTQILLKGNKKKLSLVKGENQVTVTSGGVTSNTFVFNF